MNNMIKVLTGILGILAIIACLGTIGIVGYSMANAGEENNKTVNAGASLKPETDSSQDVSGNAVPSSTPQGINGDGEEDRGNIDMTGHTHSYVESVDKKSNCYSMGSIKYTCECGAYYFADIPVTGHVSDDWEIVRKPTAGKDGLKVKKCIYCDEIMAQETIKYETEDDKGDDPDSKEDHVHEYTSSVERETSCTMAGLRKYTCSCGNFYTEMISAHGHIASDWTTVEEATVSQTGTEQRTCVVCGMVLDSKPTDVLAPTPSPSATPTASASPTATGNSSNASPSASGGASPSATNGATPTPTVTPTPTATPVPTATPHVHKYVSYVLIQPNCQEKGMRSFVCSCGSSYGEEIEVDPNTHSYRVTVIKPTKTTQGYTIYRCKRCNYSYNDNYTPALGTK